MRLAPQTSFHGLVRVLTIAVICFCLRLSIAEIIDLTVPVVKEVDVYSSIAQNLARGYGFRAEPTGEIIMWRAPLYPALLSGIYQIFGQANDRAILIVQAFMDAITATLIWGLGRHFFSEGVGLLAALVFSIHPLSAYYTLRSMPEPLFALALTSFVTMGVWSFSHPHPSRFLLTGIMGGLTALVKPIALGLVPTLGIVSIIRLRPMKQTAILAVALVILGYVMALAPWTLRNYLLTQAVIPSATGGGYALWLGNHVPTDGLEDWELPPSQYRRLVQDKAMILATVLDESPPRSPEPIDAQDRSFTEPVNIPVSHDRAFMKAAVQEMLAHPWDTLTLFGKKFLRFWFKIFLPQNQWAQHFILAGQTVFMGCAVYGFFLARQRHVLTWLLAVPVLYLALAHTITFATLRYSIPVVPILALLATVGAYDVLSKTLRRLGCWPGNLDALFQDPASPSA